MKKLLTLLSFVFFVATMKAQQNPHCDNCTNVDKDHYSIDSSSAHHKKHQHSLYWSDVSVHISKPLPKTSPWSVKVWGVTSMNKGITIDLHTGFHVKNTLDASVGYNVTKRPDTWVVPKFSLLVGEYIGFAPGFLFRMERNNWYVFSELEYLATGFEKPHMIFNFTEVGFSPHSVIEIGFISEIKYSLFHKEMAFTHSHLDHDIGPVARINVKSVYFETWWALSSVEMAAHPKVYDASTLTFALGWKFNKCQNVPTPRTKKKSSVHH